MASILNVRGKEYFVTDPRSKQQKLRWQIKQQKKAVLDHWLPTITIENGCATSNRYELKVDGQLIAVIFWTGPTTWTKDKYDFTICPEDTDDWIEGHGTFEQAKRTALKIEARKMSKTSLRHWLVLLR